MEDVDLKILKDYLLVNLGLYYTDNQDVELCRKIGDAALGFGYPEPQDFIDWLLTQKLNTEQVELLATYLTIGETYFMREMKAYDYLEFDYLPKLISEKRKSGVRRLKIWSAGCASGEEPYSIAILLKRLIPDIKDWDITILATDINPKFMQKAKNGIYSKWSFRKISPSFIENNFEELSDKKYKIKASIKAMVSFSFLNLMSDAFPSESNGTTGVDVIFCRNVMIYFSLEGIHKLVEKFLQALTARGILIVSPVEVASISNENFNRVSYHGYNIFTKDKKASPLLSIRQTLSKEHFSIDGKDREQVIRRLEASSDKLKAHRTILLKNEVEEESILLEEDTMSVYDKALKLYHADMLNEAEKLINEAVSQGEMSSNLQMLLARIMANKGELQKAESICLQVIERNKLDIDAQYFLGIVLNEQGRLKESIRAIENALFIDANFALGHYLLGSLKMQVKGDWKKHFGNARKILSQQDNDKLLDEIDKVSVGSLKNNMAMIEL